MLSYTSLIAFTLLFCACMDNRVMSSTPSRVECDSCKTAVADTVKPCQPWPVCHDPKPPRFP